MVMITIDEANYGNGNGMVMVMITIDEANYGNANGYICWLMMVHSGTNQWLMITNVGKTMS